ncbi:hypothetical protein F5984_25780 [Rudanella paleaurantiibacter]|uniref:Uncharacterized protein n=1 Tax=Rudanella paleaurantiibacter TaxID=2614655 RepID=A0A7J5TRY8_9BACT|nr:hypothetical protein [Rudanella paleaurantiibacter]KAB7725584.1 hypothetical protein F5984_25780 [Rudanella paleaurantiibacter]
MKRTLPFLLITVTLTAQAQQPKAPPLTITADSVALFSIEEDALQTGRELQRQQGYVSQIELTPQGGIRFGVWRQHNTYLTAHKATHLRTGLNALPALMHL